MPSLKPVYTTLSMTAKETLQYYLNSKGEVSLPVYMYTTIILGHKFSLLWSRIRFIIRDLAEKVEAKFIAECHRVYRDPCPRLA